MNLAVCWCGNADFAAFSPEYGECRFCGTLVHLKKITTEQLIVRDDESDFYGKQYWLEHQQDSFGYADINTRTRGDLSERNLHWLKILLKYRLPPGEALELGCAHGSFVALLRQAGYGASGVEMSPWVVDFARRTFDIPVFTGPVETLDLPANSLDAIALMDVLEHLPDPLATMEHCLKLLKPDGLLLIQTPQYLPGSNYTAMVEHHDAFLEQLKADEHLYLFSRDSVTAFFARLSVEHIAFEPAIFAHYDMFFVASRTPLGENTSASIESALLATPGGRMVLALMDLDERLQDNSRSAADLQAQLQAAEVDRAARLELIEQQGRELGKIGQLEADIAYLKEMLGMAEADRAARLEVIERQGQEMRQMNDQLQALRSRWWYRAGKKIGTL